jgi:hypothetical protein
LIIDTLRDHPEGLTEIGLSKLIGFHRHTISKYVCNLLVIGAIFQREIGSAKLCYLREEFHGE